MLKLFFIIALVSLLKLRQYSCEVKLKTKSSGCRFVDNGAWSHGVRCRGNFNLSLLLEGPVTEDLRNGKTLGYLSITDTNVTELNTDILRFNGYTFEFVYIEGAPLLAHIAPETFLDLKHTLTDFRALGTGLPQYNREFGHSGDFSTPLDELYSLKEVFVSSDYPVCPENIELFSGDACTCTSELFRKVLPDEHRPVCNYRPTLDFAVNLRCDSDTLNGEGLRNIFRKISASNRAHVHFDIVTIRTKIVTTLPPNLFSNVSITTLWMENMPNLSSIHRDAFLADFQNNSSITRRTFDNSIQVFILEEGNFGGATKEQVDDFFTAFSSLRNIRYLRLNKLGLPFIPSHAFKSAPGGELRNLRHLSLSFDRRREDGNGISSVGSYAFAGAPRLHELKLVDNFIERFDSYSFASNETSNMPLNVEIGGNPFNDTYGLGSNAFSGAQRPLHIKSETSRFTEPKLEFFPRNVFEPFINENPANSFEVDYSNVDIWCDCGSAWMFDSDGILKSNVSNALKIKRIENNYVNFCYSSVHCKPESSFECFTSPCRIFKDEGLIHCGGAEHYNVAETFGKLGLQLVYDLQDYRKLKFSSSTIRELTANAFGHFLFKDIRLIGARNLTIIHPEAFGYSKFSLTHFSAKNTNLNIYPNFGLFKDLVKVELDTAAPYYLNRSNFNYDEEPEQEHNNETTTQSSLNEPESPGLTIFMDDNGIFDPQTFHNLSRGKGITLNIGPKLNCGIIDTCLFNCSPSQLKLQETIFKPFLDSNSKNKIVTNCYFSCECKLKWLYKGWAQYQTQMELWIPKYFGNEFYCVDPGMKGKTQDISGFSNVFGLDLPILNNGSYFDKNKC